jgi:hypothetical protein
MKLQAITASQISQAQWNTSTPSGTKAAKVKTYNDAGNLVDITYVVYSEKDDQFYDELSDAKQVSSGYMTDTLYVTRK